MFSYSVKISAGNSNLTWVPFYSSVEWACHSDASILPISEQRNKGSSQADPNRGVKTALSEMFREEFWPRNRPFWMAAGKRIESSKILKSIHMSNSEFKGFQIGAESWEVRKKCGESDLIIQWFEDLMTWWFKSFPATVQNGRFLGQNCSRNISDGAVLDPLFGRLIINR